MDRRPLFSVVTVVYNARCTLEDAIRSVTRQNTSIVEYIIIDGGSTDGTLDVIHKHDRSIDLWISEPDNGIYDAMNKGAALATGHWLIFLGADDELLVSLEELQHRFLYPDALYYGNVRIAGSQRVSGGKFSKYRMMQENICHQGIFYPISVYSQKRYSTTVGHLADHKFNIEVRGNGTKFIHIDETISLFNETGVSSIKDTTFEATKLQAIRNYFGFWLYVLKRTRTVFVKLLRLFKNVTA